MPFSFILLLDLSSRSSKKAAPEDLKAANADFSVMVNSLLVARLILNLKSAGSKSSTYHWRASMSDFRAATAISSHVQSQPGRWEALVLGDIGNDLEGQSTEDSVTDVISLKPTRSSLRGSSTNMAAPHTSPVKFSSSEMPLVPGADWDRSPQSKA